MCNALCFFHNVWGIVYFWVYSEQKKKNFTVLLSVKRICHCCSNRHLGQSLTQNIRSSQSPGHGSHPCWMSWQSMDKGNLLLPSSTSTSEKCWPGLWFPWIICCNSGYSQLCYCDATHSFDQRPPSGSQWFLKYSWIYETMHFSIWFHLDFSQISFVCLMAWFAWAALIRLGRFLDLPEQDWSGWNVLSDFPEQDWSD